MIILSLDYSSQMNDLLYNVPEDRCLVMLRYNLVIKLLTNHPKILQRLVN